MSSSNGPYCCSGIGDDDGVFDDFDADVDDDDYDDYDYDDYDDFDDENNFQPV